MLPYLLLLLAPAADVLRIDTRDLTLVGPDAVRQVLVVRDADGKAADVTREAAYVVAPADVARIDATGHLVPLKDGKATLTATLGGLSVTAPVEVTRFAEDVRVSFANEVVPIFTKFGCNGGGCHGKASGQNGFKLSLLGFEPADDFETVVREARGRRIFPAAPDRSLLVTKAVGAVAHGGGKKLDASSPFAKVLTRWISQGAPAGSSADPVVTAIDVSPGFRVLARGKAQQLVVLAKMSDGTTRDVTRMTTFEANQADLCGVSETGLVSVKDVPGRLSVMARFQSHVGVFTGVVPLGAPMGTLPPGSTFVDALVFKQLRELGLPPSALVDDAGFLRRVTLDLAGRLPTVKEVEAYLADTSAKKHEAAVDRLLATADHADYFANKWSSVLRNRRASAQDNPLPTQAFHKWIRESISTNKPYDAFVREILTASGEEVKTPPVVWYRELKDAASMTEDAAQLFLGQRIACAKCHHHPLEKWSQEDYFGLTAFFSKVEVKIPPPAKGKKPNPKNKEAAPEPPPAWTTVNLKRGDAKATNPRTNKPVKPTGLGSATSQIANDVDPRLALAEWMTARDNPFFAKTLVNRTWKHFMGRGLVDPEDDMRATNPATHPELLEALAKDFVANKYDVRKLMRTICTSTAYRLSATPNAHNASDRQSHSRFLPRRLHAEVLLDAIDAVTMSKTTFKGAPAGTRAVQLPDNLFDSYFLSVFGRPDAGSACECERSGDASLAQCLHMLNSQEILGKVGGGRAKELAKDKRPHAERLRELYLVALSRPPSKEEAATLLSHIEKKKGDVAGAYEDIIWVVINTKEFLFNH